MKDPARATRDCASGETRPLELMRQRCAAAEQALENCRRALMLSSVGSAVAHDFNNLLGVISNSHHLLHRLCSDPAAQAALAASGRAVARGTQLTALWQRLSTERAAAAAPIDLRVFLQGMADVFKLIAGKRIQLSLHVAPQTRRALVDPNQLELALIALLTNAREAMPAGGQLWFDARNAEPAQDPLGAEQIALTVTDDGPGMNPAQLARVFEPYFTTRRAQGASGLGLSQVKAFCVAAGGSTRLASTVGLGTAVTLLLPAQMPALQPDPAGSSISNDSPGASSTSINGNAKLLLVEDSDDMAEVTSALLQNHGYRVHWARDADEAWRMLEREHDFSVVLSDVVMPGSTDGLALARKVRQRWPALPVVLISGEFTGSEPGGKLIVLHKPCPPELLVATLQTEIARFGSRPANA